MNSSIILAQQPLNILNNMQQGQSLAIQQRQFQNQNALNDTYKQHGAAALNGDQNALNALAGVDFQTANQVKQQGIMNARADAAAQARGDALKLATQKHAATLSAQQRYQEAAKLEGTLRGAASFYAKNDRAGYDNWLRQNETDPAEFPFDQFEATAAQAGEVIDTLRGFQEQGALAQADPQTQVAKLGADFSAGLIDQATYEAALKKATAQDGLFVSTDANGNPVVAQGAGIDKVEKPKLTVDEGKNSGFLIRGRNSNKVLDELDGQGTNIGAKILSLDPTGLTNYLQSGEWQRYDQARRDFINAVLRRESGAVIADSEFANANQQYFPQPGNPPEVIAQKARNRRDALAGFEVGAGKGADTKIVRDNAPAQASNFGESFEQMQLSDVKNVDIGTLNSAQLEAFSARYEDLTK